MGDKVRQKILCHVGSADHPATLEKLLELAEEIMQRMLHDSSPLFRKLPFTPASNRSQRNEDFEDVSLKALAGDEVFNCGIPDVCGQLYDDLGLPKLFRGRSAALHHRILKN